MILCEWNMSNCVPLHGETELRDDRHHVFVTKPYHFVTGLLDLTLVLPPVIEVFITLCDKGYVVAKPSNFSKMQILVEK